ncbi:von Willebrand factor type A domain protein [Novipirellula aureliae]|uniref:von Willebrand factor type A domain protein n=1 Tax=Novipirellula aureliae TaxID=2527966 RepID=A0A5C6EAG2_9BACT|nr:vWA domain-containing protein [Novipirellula aureliae]TWU45710.1 von Willebrand factor type A domain protein [Novipirellula aureliae]
MPFDHQTHTSRPWLAMLLRGSELFPALLMAVAVVLIARPQVLRVPEQDRVATHITVCMDVSGSMGISLEGQSRYEVAADAIESFTHAREGDAMGLTLFGSWPMRWVPLTKDLQAIRNALSFANPRNQPTGMGGTMIGSALQYCAGNMQREGMRLDGVNEGPQNADQWKQQQAAEQLFRPASMKSSGATTGFAKPAPTDRLLILVSDGMSSDLNGQEQIDDVSRQLNDVGITMYHIHIGNDAIPSAVSTIARETGGDAFLATNSDGLRMIFSHIDQMQPARFQPTASVPVDYFEPFVFIAAIGLLLYAISLLKWRYTPW